MEIKIIPILQMEETLPPTDCSICGRKFQAGDPLEFICPACRKALIGHCPNCKKYDDIRMDWRVDTESPYFWIIECCCGYELKSRPCDLIEMDEVGQQLYITFLSLWELPE